MLTSASRLAVTFSVAMADGHPVRP